MGPYQIQVPDVAALTRKGYAVVSLNYRLLRRPGDAFVDYALPAVQDGKAAVRFLRANAAKYGLDPEKIAVWGNSAGGSPRFRLSPDTNRLSSTIQPSVTLKSLAPCRPLSSGTGPSRSKT
jgi:carboxylesterase type B